MQPPISLIGVVREGESRRVRHGGYKTIILPVVRNRNHKTGEAGTGAVAVARGAGSQPLQRSLEILTRSTLLR